VPYSKVAIAMTDAKWEPNNVSHRKLSMRELFIRLLEQLERVEDRLVMLEANATLRQNSMARHGRSIEDLNTRCIERLGKICPMNGLDNDTDELPVVDDVGSRRED
jgi:hypothetical protein